MNRFALYVLVMLVILPGEPATASRKPLVPVPDAIASNHFTVTIDGRTTPVFHAALNLYFLNFDAAKHARISIAASTDDFWNKGVEVQPWRLGIRPKREGRTISFTLNGPAKISISRPGDYLRDAEMLYLFANQPEVKPPTSPTAGIRYFGPGAHTENIDAQTGDSIYLAPSAVIFGSLNLWGVQHVKVFGRGVIVYDGPQNPADDDGWMHKPNWHCITMDNAHDISIEGITCVVRSRTWQIQMKDSRNILFDNIKVIGANTGNANADGMDWLGGGDTIVRDSFFRAADDVFSMETGWDGYGPVSFALQGSPVTNITVENSVLSTSISNIVRAGWPEKNMEGGNFQMRDSDVLHMGLGGCGVPFALMELWADPNGRGQTAGYHFNNIRLEDWYTLTQLRQRDPGIRDVSFTDIAALEQPALVPSVLLGHAEQISFDNVTAAGALAASEADLPLERQMDAPASTVTSSGPKVRILTDTGLVLPGQRVHFKALVDGASHDLHYTWIFGDGATGQGPIVTHKFPDAQGTLLDGSGRFRVLLHVFTPDDRHTWAYEPIVVSESLLPAQTATAQLSGVLSTYSELDAAGAPTLVATEVADSFSLPAVHRDENYAVSLQGDIYAPLDGTYTLALIANDDATMSLDGKQISSTPQPFAQVCGLAGNAARFVSIDLPVAKGRHHLAMTEIHRLGHDDFKVLWRRPGGSLQAIGGDALSQP